MPNGPPWIHKVEQMKFTSLNPLTIQDAYHVELDENKLWTIKFSIQRSPDDTTEISMNISKPGERVIVFNDHYDNAAGSPGETDYKYYKFDNEDIYISAQWLDRGGLGWTTCTPSGAAISGAQGNELSCEFTSPRKSKVSVRLVHE